MLVCDWPNEYGGQIPKLSLGFYFCCQKARISILGYSFQIKGAVSQVNLHYALHVLSTKAPSAMEPAINENTEAHVQATVARASTI